MHQSFLLALMLSVATASASPVDISLFKDTYQESREEFLKLAGARAQKFVFKKMADVPLEIDYVLIPATTTPKTLIIVNSGIHGIEGFVGSAVQRQWLRLIKDESLPGDIGVLMIHGMNPYGFIYHRRVNEINVDLNRNFAIESSLYSKKSPEYGTLNDFLNPSDRAQINFYSGPLFYVNSVVQIFRHSIGTIRKAVLKGQHEFPDGLYFGGAQPQSQQGLTDYILMEIASKYQRSFIIDLHTGFGERGKLHLLSASLVDPKANELQKIFAKRLVDFGKDSDFYSVEGDFVAYCLNRLRVNYKKEAHGLGFEFGTLDSQKSMGSIESLRRMVLENQDWHHPAALPEESKSIRNLFDEMFFPSDPEWRRRALEQSLEAWNEVIAYYASH